MNITLIIKMAAVTRSLMIEKKLKWSHEVPLFLSITQQKFLYLDI